MNYKQAWTYLIRNNSDFCWYLKDYFRGDNGEFMGFTQSEFKSIYSRYNQLYSEQKGFNETLYSAFLTIDSDLSLLGDVQARKKTKRLEFKLIQFKNKYCLYCQRKIDPQFETRKTKRFCSDKCRVYFARKKPLIDLSDNWFWDNYTNKEYDNSISESIFKYQILCLKDADYYKPSKFPETREIEEYNDNLAFSLLGLSCMLDTPENREIEEIIEQIKKKFAELLGISETEKENKTETTESDHFWENFINSVD